MDIYPFQRILNRKFFPVFSVFIDGYADEFYLLMGENLFFLTSSLRTPKFFVKEFSYFLMPCHQHGLRINLLVQR